MLLFRSGLTFELSRVATRRGVRETEVRCHVGLNERLGLNGGTEDHLGAQTTGAGFLGDGERLPARLWAEMVT